SPARHRRGVRGVCSAAFRNRGVSRIGHVARAEGQRLRSGRDSGMGAHAGTSITRPLLQHQPDEHLVATSHSPAGTTVSGCQSGTGLNVFSWCGCQTKMIEIDATLVRELIRTQFPQWAGLPITPVENGGWDNRTFHLGDRMSVRLPSAPAYVAQVEKEHRWLP